MGTMQRTARHGLLGALAWLMLAVLWAAPTLAREAVDPCEGGMSGASAAYAQSYQDELAMGHSRAFAFRDVGMAAIDEILGSGFGDTAVALFAHSGERHCVYILAHRDIEAFGVSATRDGPAAARIAALVDAWRRSAGAVEGPARGLRTTLLAGKKPAPRALPASPAALAADGERLAQALFPQDTRARLASFKRLVILPYAGLGAIPYAALPLDGTSLFVDRLAITISPGPRYFGAARPELLFDGRRAPCATRGPATAAVVLGDPVVPVGTGTVFPALPGARREAIDVAKRFAVNPALGKDAVRGAVLAAGTGTPLIHIAAHGVANSQVPLESYLALADGPWTAGEIQRACLSGTRIAVLSACQSGLGGNHDGGIIGLGRAFILAGSANVAMSLWSVDDAGTEVLMRNFMQALADKPDAPDAALRDAMLATRRERPQPFVWAAFAILGG